MADGDGDARGRTTFTCIVAGKSMPVTCFAAATEDYVRLMLTGKVYPRVTAVENVRTIVDIGANVGLASIYFASIYPDASIYAFEPDPGSFELLRSNVVPLPTIRAFGHGLFERDGTARLHLGTKTPGSSSIGISHLNGNAVSEIRLRDAAAALDELDIAAIDILKIDTEGCELPILRRLGPRLSGAKIVYLEYHDDDDRRAIDRLLQETHVLCGGRVVHAHRGEFVYVARTAFGKHDPDAMRIRIDPALIEPA
jgi:FkbM family methyltransferase